MTPLRAIHFALLVLAGACSRGDSASTVSDASATDAAVSSVDARPIEGGDADAIMDCAHCSADLHDVIDCQGNVVFTCPSDQGCFKGVCEPACDAARDNKSTVGCDYLSL